MFSKFRASLIGKEFENAALALPVQAFTHFFLSSFDLLGQRTNRIRIQNHFHISGSTVRKSVAFKAFPKSVDAAAESRGKSRPQCDEED